MKSIYCMVGILFMLLQGSWQNPLQETGDKSSGVSRRNADFQNNIEDTKDMNKYLEAQAVKESVHWLKAEGKKPGVSRRNAVFERHAEGTYTSDISNYLEAQAVKEFIDWLIKGRPKRKFNEVTKPAEKLNRRPADGRFTNDMNKVLDTMAAKEFLQ